MAATNQFSSLQQPCKWVKGKVIGSGSYGAVHLAINKVTGGLFVAKCAHSGVSSKSLEHEASILESLDSPYMVRCMGKGWQKGSDGGAKLNVFMEYMAGGSLSDMAEKFGGAVDEEVIRLYTKQILNGLKYLHENGIVHCDLKCKNVLLGSSGNIKLADFGCAQRLKDPDRNGKLACSWQSAGGTPLWMAPEVLRKEGLDFSSDIWSLGCTVIEMATGRPPWGYTASDPMAVVLKIAFSNERPKFPAHLSEEGMDFLAKCLERDPESRWTAEELLDHPFITGNSQKKCACSPASVLDSIGTYEEEDADEPGNPDEHLRWNPFSMRNCGKPKIIAMRQHADNDFGSSGDWITVRSASHVCGELFYDGETNHQSPTSFSHTKAHPLLPLHQFRKPVVLPQNKSPQLQFLIFSFSIQSFSAGDWRVKREESYDDEAVEEIK
uniref:Protein kinase domain-containing protein n=1 Tax=Salix viminalis TaxID=40686 RepID=A0A6N2JXJ1_SALVM